MQAKESFLELVNIFKTSMKKIIIVLVIVISAVGFSQKKINGISFVASNNEVNLFQINPVINVNANWVTLMPFAFMKSINDTTIIYNSKNQWKGERKEGITNTAKLFKTKKIKVMLKPQIWIPNGFTGHIKMNSDKEWKSFEKNYENYILFYAKIAQDTNCELFCIGTEMNSVVMARPNYWNNLIVKIKKLYSGKITYAENWDTYKNVSFIDKLDFIGIDAYFPLDKAKTPSIDALVKAWKPVKIEIEKLSKKHNKKVIFTEYGYQSKDFTTLEPWEHSKSRVVNLKGQENALLALYKIFWKETWFAGGFLWKWYDNHEKSGGKADDDYTVQNKPSELIVKNQYKE